jgi:hypothetical protein
MSQLQPIPSILKTTLTLLAWSLLPLSIPSVIVLQHFDGWPSYRNGIWYDPIELNPFIKSDLRAAEQETGELLKNDPVVCRLCSLGRQRCYWLTKQAILRDKYGIKWRTPAEMNPGKFN